MQVYRTSVFDGCRQLVRPTLAARKRAQGELWHAGKNWRKWAELAAISLCRRPKPASEQLTHVAKVTIDPARYEAYGVRPKGLSAINYAWQRVRALGPVAR